MKLLKSALLYFAIVFACGFALGIPRVLVLVPRLGERWAELLEMPLMLVAIVFAARFVVRRCALPPRAGIRLGVGLGALALTLAAEAGAVLALRGISIADYLAGRDPVSGGAFALLLLAFAAMPALVGRR